MLLSGSGYCWRAPTITRSEFSDSLQAGASFTERYKILAELGQGGMCDVYLVHDALLDREVALKVLKQCYASDLQNRNRFREEAKATSTLKHPHIVGILAFGNSREGTPFIAMEYLKGKTLEQILLEEHTLSTNRFVHLFAQITAALAYAHSQGIIHRDIKPANIMICANGNDEQAKILDFGIAKILEQSSAERTATVGLLGSPLYMSPEQCSAVSADRRSDIYSLACVMYEALAGSPPFKADTALATMYEHLNLDRNLLSKSLSSSSNPQLAKMIVKALARDPDRRQNSMQELLEVLELMLQEIDADSEPAQKPGLSRAGKIGLAIFSIAVIAVFLTRTAFTDLTEHLTLSPSRRVAGSSSAIAARSSSIAARNSGHSVAETELLSLPSLLEEIASLELQHKYKEAEERCGEALKRLANRKSDCSEKLCQVQIHLARIYKCQQKYSDAIKEYKQARDMFSISYADLRLEAVDGLCDTLVSAGQKQEGLQLYQTSLKTAHQEVDQRGIPRLSRSYLRCAALLLQQGQAATAMSFADTGINDLLDYRRQYRTHHGDSQLVDACWEYYALCQRSGKLAKGKKVVEECRTFLKEPNEDSSAINAMTYAKDAQKFQQYKLAREMYEFSLQELSKLRRDQALEIRDYCLAELKNLR